MIKVEHHISFGETGVVLSDIPLTADMASTFAACHNESESRGCQIVLENNSAQTESKTTYIWNTLAEVEDMYLWGDTNYQLTELYQQYVSLIESAGGTVTRTITEF
jgi:hypothetical protein